MSLNYNYQLPGNHSLDSVILKPIDNGQFGRIETRLPVFKPFIADGIDVGIPF